MDKIKRIEELVQKLNSASEAYYGGKDEIVSNFEWDEMFDELTRLENETGHIMPDSPTQRVSNSDAEEESSAGVKEEHEFPALSLAKTKDVAEVEKWVGDKEAWVSWKLDGLTLVVTYDGGELTKILTRGNGTVGTNISYFKDVIKGIPARINYDGHMVIRGEATISYSDFEVINELNDTGEKYANPRNLASGTLALDPIRKDIVKSRNLTFVAFSLIFVENEIVSWGERMSFLDSLGFKTVEREKTNAAGISDVIENWSKKVEAGYDIPVDGLVICYDDTEFAATGSVTGHHATRGGLAFKWQDEVAVSTLKYIEWSCATSVITPIAVFEPVQLEGTVVSRASLCNISELDRLGIGEDGQTTIQVIKANKIIPKCVGVLKAEGKYHIPEKCPVCSENTKIVENDISKIRVLQCTNTHCPAKNLSRFTRFVSKNGMDIDGFSIQTIRAFINKGFIGKFQDIYKLADYKDEICEMEGFGEKSCANLLEAIEKSKSVNPVNFIFSLSIPLIGVDAAKKIIKEVGYSGFVTRLRENQGFEDVSGIGAEKSNSILSWFEDEDNRQVFERLNEILEIQDTTTAGGGEKCKDISFVITGSLNTFANRKAFVEYIEQQGGKVIDSVSSKTDYLVNNDVNSKSSKNVKAQKLGIPIISEEEFLLRFGSES